MFFAIIDYIDMARAREQDTMKKRDLFLNMHKQFHKIWKGSDGKWCTYLPDDKKGRKFVKKNTEEDVENTVIEYYTKQAQQSIQRSFMDVYYEWRGYHDKMVTDNTTVRHDEDIPRYFEGTDFANQNIKKFTEDDITVFIKTNIDEKNLCKKAAKTLYGYISNTFAFAERHEYIEKDPTRYLKAKDFYQYCEQSKRSQREQVIKNEYYQLISDKLAQDHIKTPNYIPSYAVEFAFMTGMRVGEIAGLTWDCIFDEYILIDKSEKYNQKTKEYFISKTKTGKERVFPMTSEIRVLLAKVKEIEIENGWIGKWVFANENGRIHFRIFSSCIKNKCKQCGIQTFGIHACWKTLNSNMRSNGVSSVVAASLLGHSPEVNEKYYTFDVTNVSDKAGIISAAYNRISGQ